MKFFLPALLSLAFIAAGSASALDAGSPAKPASSTDMAAVGKVSSGKPGDLASQAPALPTVPQPHDPETVPVPETLGISMLAGVGFLFMFSRRRYS